MAKSKWQSLALPTLAGVFDARSRPADIANTSLRWRENFGINDTGHLARAQGFRKLFPWSIVNGVYTNADLHKQANATREPVTLIYEHTANDGTKTLFAGTQSNVYRYNGADWDTILTGGTSGTRWKAASLGDYIIFTNDYDAIKRYLVTTGAVDATITTLHTNLKVTRAKVAVYFFGFVLLMNVVQDTVRQSSRIRWCELNDSSEWEYSLDEGHVAGFQDLDYGDPILAAAVLGSNLYIYTTRNIWRCYLNTASNVPFGFQRVYSEPKNQTGCLAYPNSLVSTGDAHYFMARDGIYKWTQYATAPERVGWIHAASALIYSSDYTTHINSAATESPIGEFDASKREIVFSWPDNSDSTNPNQDTTNQHSLVCNVLYNTCDYRNVGWTAMASFTSDSTATSVSPYLIGCCGHDWCLKMLGDVYYRELASIANKTVNMETPPTYTTEGYDSLIRGTFPLGVNDRDKEMRRLILDHDTVEEADPCVVEARIGNSQHIVDCNQTTGRNRPQWIELEDRILKAPDANTVEELAAKGQRPDAFTEWPMYVKGNYLHFELKIVGAESATAEGADTAWSALRYEVAVV